MKHYFQNSLRALFLSLSVLLSLPMLAVHVEIDGINYDLVEKTHEATVLYKSSGSYSGDIVIPESVEYEGNYPHEGTTYRVISIGFNAFRGDSNMIKFDKLLSRHGSREIGYSYSFRLSPSFLRKFFAKKQTMEYFLDIFNNTY